MLVLILETKYVKYVVCFLQVKAEAMCVSLCNYYVYIIDITYIDLYATHELLPNTRNILTILTS